MSYPSLFVLHWSVYTWSHQTWDFILNTPVIIMNQQVNCATESPIPHWQYSPTDTAILELSAIKNKYKKKKTQRKGLTSCHLANNYIFWLQTLTLHYWKLLVKPSTEKKLKSHQAIWEKVYTYTPQKYMQLFSITYLPRALSFCVCMSEPTYSPSFNEIKLFPLLNTVLTYFLLLFSNYMQLFPSLHK